MQSFVFGLCAGGNAVAHKTAFAPSVWIFHCD